MSNSLSCPDQWAYAKCPDIDECQLGKFLVLILKMINDWNFLNLGHFSPQKGTYASVMTVLEFHSVVDEIQLILHPNDHPQKILW